LGYFAWEAETHTGTLIFAENFNKARCSSRISAFDVAVCIFQKHFKGKFDYDLRPYIHEGRLHPKETLVSDPFGEYKIARFYFKHRREYEEVDVFSVYACMNSNDVPALKPEFKQYKLASGYTPVAPYPSEQLSDFGAFQDIFTCEPRLRRTQIRRETKPKDNKSSRLEKVSGIEKLNGLAGLCGNAGFPGLSVGNPIVPTTGNKVHIETDYIGVGPFPLVFQRTYNSQSAPPYHWQHNYQRYLYRDREGGQWIIRYVRGDGQVETFTFGEALHPDKKRPVSLRLVERNHFIFEDEQGNQETVLLDNIEKPIPVRLIRIRNAAGFEHLLTHDEASRVLEVFDTATLKSLRFEYPDFHTMILIDPAKQKTHYQTDAAWRLTRVTKPNGGQTNYHYEDIRHPALLTGITDALGNRYATWRYDEIGRAMLSVHAEDADQTRITYDDASNRVLVADPWGKTSQYDYQIMQGLPKPIAVGNAYCPTCERQIAFYEYDQNGFLRSTRDKRGLSEVFTFNPQGLLTSKERGGTDKAEYTWHPDFKHMTSRTEHNLKTTWGYDKTGLLTSKTETDIHSSLSRTTTYQYDRYRRISRIDGPRLDVEDITRFEYEPGTSLKKGEYEGNSGNLRSVTNPLGHMEQWEIYDLHGRPQRFIGKNGEIIETRYTPLGNIAMIKKQNATWRYHYDLNGRLVMVENPMKQRTQYTFDAAHRLTGVTFPSGARMALTYNTASAVTQKTLFSDNGTERYNERYVYNTLGQPIGITNGNGDTTHYTYDANGQMTEIKNAQGRTWKTEYDLFSHPEKSITPDENIQAFRYDPQGNLTSYENPFGQLTTFRYNGFGERISELSSDRGERHYTYDNAGILKNVRFSNGEQINYAYDAGSRLVKSSTKDDTSVFTYDEGTYGKGKLTGTQNGAAKIRYAYDAMGNLTKTTYVFPAAESEIGYTYDLVQRVQNIRYPGGKRLTMMRDASGSLQALIYDNKTLVREIRTLPGETGEGPVLSYTLGNGVQVHHTYDMAYQRTSTAWMLSPPGPIRMQYQYDATGNVIKTGTADTQAAYTYDIMDRLTGAPLSRWEYDILGNRVTQTKEKTKIQYGYSHHGKLETIQHTQKGQQVRHDVLGRVVQKGDYAFSYDGNENLSEVRYQGNIIASYSYNVKHQRLKKTTYANPTLKLQAGITYFLYDEKGHLIAELGARGTAIREYVYLNDEPAALIENGKVYYFLNSKVGSPQILTDEARKMVWEAEYTPFGEVKLRTEKLKQPLRFPGQYYDEETGLHYNWHRYYDPSLGRYLQPDPIGLAGGANLYAYVGSNPLRFVDPMGLDWVYSQSTGNMYHEPNEGGPRTLVGTGYAGHWLRDSGGGKSAASDADFVHAQGKRHL
jgi:RHS repeat-associated protein